MPSVGNHSSETGSVDVLALPSGDAVAAAGSLRVPASTALADYRRLHREGAAAPWMGLPEMPIVRRQAEGPTVKFAQRLPGAPALETESVLLPQHSARGGFRTALCVSSQVGCAMGCGFCETAQMGRMRQLAASEIVAQWHAARFAIGFPVDTVVFMGMGEPMDNLDAVLRAIEVLVDHNGPSVPASRITVSTVGLVDGIRRYTDFAARHGFRRLNLAVSLNAPNDDIRSAIMPVNLAAPMDVLFDALWAWVRTIAPRLLVEYVLIPGVNDADAHADELVARLGALPAAVNVIPYNPRRDSPWPAPDEATVRRFTDRIAAGGRLVTRRHTMGRSLMGACGQLGNPEIRRRRFVDLAVR